jgi:hypothetical protein
MSKAVWLVSITVVAAGMWLPAARATDYPSELVSFEGGSVDATSAKEIFREPQWSPSTMGIHLNTTTPTPAEDWNSAYKSTDFNGGYDGVQNLKVFFSWDATQVPLTDPAYQWVRLTTYSGALRPNPALDTRGRVEFRILNRSGMFTGEFGLVLGIRETGVVKPQMGDGGVSGGIEWVGVTTANTIVDCGTNGCDPGTTLAGDDEQFNTNGKAWINWGPDRVLQSTAAGDDTVIAGYIRSPKGSPVPIPAVTITNSSDWLPVVFNLATGDVTFDGNTVDGKVVSFASGNGVLDPPNFRGTLEHLGIVRVASDPCDLSQACNIDFGIDALQFVATVPDPTVPPRVVPPLINGDTEVTVTDLMYSVNRVTLYRRANSGAPWVQAVPPIDVTNSDDVTFDISSAPAVTGEQFAATQRNGQDGSTSDYSAPVPVYSGPPPFTFSAIIDGGGTGSCTGSAWEWINVTGLSTAVIDGVSRWYPQGATAIFPDDATWQTIDLSLTDTTLMRSAYGGNGQLEPSPTGFWNMDTIWFTVGPGVSSNGGGWGPHEVFIDRIEAINSNGVAGDTLLSMEDGVNRFASIRGQSPLYSVTTGLSSVASYDGNSSHRLAWTYTGIQTAAGILQRTSAGCGTAAQIKDTSLGLRFHVLFRNPQQAPTIPMPSLVYPIVKGTQTTMSVRVNNDTTATAVQLYVNGAAVGSPANPAGLAYVDFTGLTLNVGDSISAKQTLPAGESDFAYPRAVSAAPNPPTLQTQILPAATTITVNNCLTTQFATASTVYVYVNGNYTTPRGSAAAGTASVNVTISPAVSQLDVVTAKQMVNGALSGPSAPVTVSVPAPVIYAVPAEGDTTIKVQGLHALATSASIKVKDSGGAVVGTYSQSFAAGSSSVIVPVSGLVVGYTVTAYQTVNGADSGESALERVSVNTVTTIFSDTMETYVDLADFANTSGEVRSTGWWPSSGDPTLYLDIGGKNATPGGTKSAYYPAGRSSPYLVQGDGWQCNFDFTYPEPNWPVFRPTATAPIVFSVNMYDSAGPGVDNVFQWANIVNYSDANRAIVTMGMPGTYYYTSANNAYYQARINLGAGYLNLNLAGAPQRSIGWHTFTAVIKLTQVDFYVDGILSAKNAARTDFPYDNLYMGSGDASPVEGWFDDFRVHQGKFQIADRIPTQPRIVAPVAMSDTTVRVTGIAPAANSVTVYANGSAIGTLTLSPPNTLTTLDVPVSPGLVYQQVITAKQTVTALGTSDASVGLVVGRGNAPIMLGVGIRETGATGALGSTDPATSGAIEWINVTTNGTERIGYKIHPQPTWQTITLSSANGVTKFPSSGNGVINGTRGALEHLAIFMNANTNGLSTGPYRMYIDNVYNLNADGGPDFLLTGFESYALGAEVLFQEPTYSGTTLSLLDYWFGSSAATDKYASAGTQSLFLTWFWKDTAAGTWIRETTSGATNLSRPVIDITKPIQMDVLLLPYCVKGDMDSNCSIDLTDYTAFQACLGGPLPPAIAPTCGCADFDEDGQVDLYDFAEFQRTFTGAGTISGCTP